MLADGRLPVLADLRRQGRWERLDAKATILQSSTYPTLCTGVDVLEHGLYSAYPWSPSDQRARFSQAFPKPRTIWERLTERGRRSLIVDPYLAWPPRAMAGIYLSGWHFEDRMVTQGRSVPPDVRRSLASRHGQPPKLDDVYGRPSPSALHVLREQLVGAPQRTVAAAADLLSAGSYDLVWVNFGAAHKAGHHLWDPGAIVGDAGNTDSMQDIAHGLEQVYEAVDEAIGRIVQLLPEDADVIVFAPTGMGANTSRADLLPGMLGAVLADGSRQERPRRNLGAPVWAIRSRIPVEWRAGIARTLPDLLVADLTTRLYLRADWQRTQAIAVPGENKGYVRLNLKGREREGIVDPAGADDLLVRIEERLLTFRDPDGAPSIAAVERMSDLVGDRPYSQRLPDLVVSWNDRPAAGVDRVSSPGVGTIMRSGVGSGRSGNHTDDAWAVVVPRSSRYRALGREPRITDIGATACALFDADPTGLTGASLLEAG